MPDLTDYPAIDVAIGLMVLFFLLSIVCSAIQEFVAAVIGLRARYLERGLKKMLGDQRAADLEKNLPTPKPSYIAPRQFSLAILDTLAPDEPSDGLLAKAKDSAATIQNLGVRRPLVRMIEGAQGDIAKFRKEVEEWFDASMDRVSGWYKRAVQMILILLATAVTLSFNVDTFHVANQLWSDPALRASLVEKSDQILETQTPEAPSGGQEPEAKAQETCPPPDMPEQSAQDCIKDKLDDVAKSVDDVQELDLPIGWRGDNVPDEWSDAPGKVAGWIVTIFALSLGAPFWFDALGRVSRLRAAGPKPEAKS